MSTDDRAECEICGSPVLMEVAVFDEEYGYVHPKCRGTAEMSRAFSGRRLDDGPM